MALSVLDGNQSATTLSSVVTGGEHIVAHSVVCFGSTAISNITNAVSGSVISISNFPATQVVSVSNFPASSTVTVGNTFIAESGTGAPAFAVGIGYNTENNTEFLAVNDTGNNFPVAVKNSITIGSLPAISGTVTANVFGRDFVNDISQNIPVCEPNDLNAQTSILPVGIQSGTVNVGNSVTIGSLPAISGTVTVGNSVTIGSLPTLTPQLPRVTFIDGSGSVTTANTAVTVFASSSTRSYLLVQVTTGSAFVNVGATATTLNGINLTAGQGYAWETTIPQGAVSLISTTTSSRYVAKEA